MRRSLKYILWSFPVLAFLILAGGWATVFFYGDEIKQKIVAELNRHLHAEITVRDIHFSVFRHFPYASVEFEDVLARAPSGAFSEDTLFAVQRLFFLLNLKDIYHKQYNARSLVVKNGKFNLEINKDGKDNYSFWNTGMDTATGNFAFSINKILFENIAVSFHNETIGQSWNLYVENALSGGRFTEDSFSVEGKCRGVINQLIIDRTIYAEHLPFGMEINMDANAGTGTYSIREANISVAKLPLSAKGNFHYIPGNSVADIALEAKGWSIEKVFALLPPKYNAPLKKYHSRGVFYFTMHLNGIINALNNPLLDMRFGISGGELSLPVSKANLKKINLTGNYTNGIKHNLATSRLDIKNFSATLGDKPLETIFTISNFADPWIDMHASAEFDLQDLQLFYTNENIETLEGKGKCKFSFSGRKNDLSGLALRTGTIRASGEILLAHATCRLKNDPRSYSDWNADFIIENNNLMARNCSGHIASCDFDIKGSFGNFFSALLLPGEELSVNAEIHAGRLDLDELLQPDVAGPSEGHGLPFPYTKDAAVKLTVGELKYHRFTAKDLKGDISVKDKTISFSPFVMKSMNGTAILQGTIDMSRSDSILVACEGNFSKIDISRLFYETENFGQEVMTHKNIRGTATGNLSFASIWAPGWKIDPEKVYAASDIRIDDGELLDFAPMMALSRFVRLPELNDIRFETLKNHVEIRKQKVFIPSMEVHSTALNLSIEGVHTFDNEVDYRITLLLAELLGKKIKKESAEFGEVKDDGLGHTRIFLTMKGKADNPVFAYDKKAAAKKIKTDIVNEKQTMKNVLKEEFGWFKNDSTLSVKERKKEVLQIDWDDYNKKHSSPEDTLQEAPAPQKSRTENRRKKAFGKLSGGE